jgi:hypothetical protein
MKPTPPDTPFQQQVTFLYTRDLAAAARFYEEIQSPIETTAAGGGGRDSCGGQSPNDLTGTPAMAPVVVHPTLQRLSPSLYAYRYGNPPYVP